ncbi:MAG: hypothetical protein LC722_04500 [Actinobacteria bacterium]|nr:hypothetical protein [Actinomycetota bacterium]
MRSPVRLVAILSLLALAACGGDDPADTPPATTSVAPTTESPEPQPLATTAEFTSGTASVTVTGDRTESFEGALDPEGGHGFDGDEDLELDYQSEQGWSIRLDFTPTGEGPAESDWVAVGMPGQTIDDPEYYYDGFETLCDTTLTQADSNGVAGTFTCTDLPNTAEDKTIDVEGTFSASI